MVVLGVHSPEFSFEHDIDRVQRATKERSIDYPVVVDNHYEAWSAFDNHYWPALYFVDTDATRPSPPPHDWWDWCGAYMEAREQGLSPDEASAAARRYMADVKHVLGASA